jgi:hypothetical protein
MQIEPQGLKTTEMAGIVAFLPLLAIQLALVQA